MTMRKRSRKGAKRVEKLHLPQPSGIAAPRVKEMSRQDISRPRHARRTRFTVTEAARCSVLYTVELLEQILRHLPVREIWRAKRVSKHFQTAIQGSTILRTAMMLLPSGAPALTWYLVRQVTSEEAGELGKAHFVTAPPRSSNVRVQSSMTPAQLCPLLTLCPSQDILPGRIETSTLRMNVYPHEIVQFSLRPDLQNLGLWKDMLITDPPCNSAEVFLQFYVGHGPDGKGQGATVSIKRTISSSEGLIFADLFRLPMEMAGDIVYARGLRNFSKHGIQTVMNPHAFLADIESMFQDKALLNIEASGVTLTGIVVPAENEHAEQPADYSNEMSDGDVGSSA